MEINIKQAAEFFLKNDCFVVFCHSKPDGDTAGSAAALAIALKKIGKQAVIYCADKFPERLMFLLENVEIAEELPGSGWIYTGVDIASESVMRGLDPSVLINHPFNLIIDHHKINTIKAERLLIIPEYPATGQIIAEIIEKMGIEIDKALALPLYGAVSSDSGCFKYSSTMPETYLLGAKLIAAGIDFAKINRLLFETKTSGQLMVEKSVYDNTDLYYGGKLAVTVIPPEILENPQVNDDDTESAAQIPRQIKGVEVSCVIYNRKNSLKASFRSNDYYDVSALAAKFGGGGHKHASGCRFEIDIKEVKQAVIEALKGEFDD